MYMIAMILLLAMNNCSGVCGSAETDTACTGINQRCNPCVQAACSNPERITYPTVPPLKLVSDPEGCCYEEVVVFCIQRRTCVAPSSCGVCTMIGPHKLETSLDHVIIPGEICGSNCTF